MRAFQACVVAVMCFGVASPGLAQVAAKPEPAPVPPLFQSVIKDFKRLPSKETLTWVVIGGAVAAAGQPKDWDITNGFSGMQRMHDALKPGEVIGGARAQMVGAFATYATGRLIGKPRVASVGADLVRAQIVTQAVTAGIKLTVRRHRPDGGEFSFPSGHTSVSFATATVLQRHFGWKVGVPAYAMASYVAASRVQVRRHFASDVAFGAALGIAAGRTVTVGRGKARFVVSPAIGADNAGVSFTLLNAH